jgi:hypothetical protein
MKEPYTEGLATHGDPESCAGGARDEPKAAGEALTGACTGRAIEPRNLFLRSVGAVSPRVGNTTSSASASSKLAPRGQRPLASAESLCARTGRSTDRPRAEDGSSGRDGRAQALSRR